MDDPTVAIWVFAAAAFAVGWLLGRRTGSRARAPLSRDYQAGLDHLLHGRLDAAMQVLGDVATRDDDALELKFALGSLFRKRGEVDRATGLHEQLAGHAQEPVRRRAQFELALDFVAAGLLDRAEQCLLPLAAAGGGGQRLAAQRQLLRLYEIQSDWLAALRLHQELPQDVRSERGPIAAHYLCELTDQALLTGELGRVAELLDEAQRYHPASPRAALLRARWLERSGREVEARQQTEAALRAQPALGGALAATGATYLCGDCGFESHAWLWRCPRCCAWERFAIRY